MKPNIDASIGDGALKRFARMLEKPSDLMMVAPHVARPLIDCKPLRHTSRYGQVTQLVSTCILIVVSRLLKGTHGHTLTCP
jgi:hypothetical protein